MPNADAVKLDWTYFGLEPTLELYLLSAELLLLGEAFGFFCSLISFFVFF